MDSSKFEVVQNDHNYGLGGSHKKALLWAEAMQADYLAVLHGDDQAKTEELGDLIQEAEKHPEASAILGSRFQMRSRRRGYSFARVLGNVGLNILYSAICGRSTKDLGSGLNLFRMSDLSDHRFLSFSDGMTFNIDLLLDYFSKGSVIRYFPISWSETDQKSNANAIRVGVTALQCLFQWRLGVGPRDRSL
jgi:hypothetical protein